MYLFISFQSNRETGYLSIFQLVVLVLNKIKQKINVNATNGSGLTALDIHYAVRDADKGSDKQIEDFLYHNEAKLFKELPPLLEAEPKWKKNKKHTLMVVSSLIATMAFLVGLTPPGGVFVDPSAGDKGGKAIIAYRYPNAYPCLMYVNTVGFLVSLTTILLIITALPEEQRIVGWIRSVGSWLTIMTTAFVYAFCVIIVTPNVKHERSVSTAILVTVILWAVVASLILQVRFVRARIREIRSPNQSMASLILQVLLLIIRASIRERGSPNQSMEQTQIILPRLPPDEASRSENTV
ncbi:hypothetical protein RHMOL_Rhmol01G0034500 [Rhododendron molle]|uniref:Uncharacterized protein n=1 Tax=Rhododendron molle TaxID=49168 RepID=A0ACC0Q0N1_RHOML|nr:hypothetical protein RHMOL_Rhmol01G0034500 [Rhododendron molle]